MYDDRNIAASFNEHFASVGRCLASSLTVNIDEAEISSFIPHHDSIFEFNEITLRELQSVVRSMKNVSPGDLDCHKMLCNSQFGFRSGRCTEGALQAAVLSVYGALDSGSVALGVFLDLSKAFDSLNRDVLILKLSKYGIINRELAWFKSYLTNRIIRTKWKGEISEPSLVDIGVPQGSTLGSALFLLYINDLHCVCQNSELVLFADDTNLFLSADTWDNNLCDTCNAELSSKHRWFILNKLTINRAKTHYVEFQNARRKLPENDRNVLRLGGYVIERKTSTKFLGVTLDKNLNWTLHVQDVCRKVAKFIPILCRVRQYIDDVAVKMIYYSLIYPLMTYCNSLWGNCATSHIIPLIVLQKKLVRVMTRSDFRCHTAPLF